MHRFVRSVRCAGIASVGCLTLFAGAVLVWLLVRPEMLPMLSTWHLAAILSSFVLPALCLAVWQADRRVAARLPRRVPSSAAALPARSPANAAPKKPAGPVQAAPDRKAAALAIPPARTDAMSIRFAGDSRRIHRHRRSVRV